MPVTPTGPLSEPLEYLRASLAASATFQTLVGAANATEALDAIYYHAPPPPADGSEYTPEYLSAFRPCAVVSYPESGIGESSHVATGSGFGFTRSGRVIVQLWGNATLDEDGKYDPSTDALTWGNAVGGIISDIEAVAGVAGYLAIETMTVDVIFTNATDTEDGEGRFNGAKLTIGFDHGGR